MQITVLTLQKLVHVGPRCAQEKKEHEVIYIAIVLRTPPAMLSLVRAVAGLVVANANNNETGHSAALTSYPLYLQCDTRWGSDMMGVKGNGERATICAEGCAMSCVSMALAGLDIKVANMTANPQNLNGVVQSRVLLLPNA